MITREHEAQHAPRIPREGVVFREPPDMAGGPVFSAQRRSPPGNHSGLAGISMSRQREEREMEMSGKIDRPASCSAFFYYDAPPGANGLNYYGWCLTIS